MDWIKIICDLEQAMTHAEIAKAAGMSSSGHVSNLKSGLQKTVKYEIGCKLVDLHRIEMRRVARRAKA